MDKLSSVLVATYRGAYQQVLETITRASGSSYERVILQQLAEILQSLDAEAGSWAQQSLVQSYSAGMNAVEPGAQIIGIHRQSVEVLVRNTIGDLTSANQVVGRRIEGALRSAQLRAITDKQSRGASWREAKRLLQEDMIQNGIMPAGRMRLDSYAEMVVRSASSEATNLGTMNRARQTGYDLVTISSHSNPCGVCAQYEGRVYSISGNNPNYPSLYGSMYAGDYANIHPNCRHVLIAISDRDAEPLREVSNRPFEDTRTDRERRAYAEGQTRKRRARANRDQWERYRLALGDNVPPLNSFTRMKNTNSVGYQALQQRYRGRSLED